MSSLALAPRHPLKRSAPVDHARGSLIGRNPALRRMLFAALVSTCGDRLHQVALAALVLGITNSMASAGLIFVVSTIPYALFGLPVGALVDRWDRRTAMIAADVIRGVLVLGIPLAAVINLPLVYALLFCLTCATMVFNPARQSAIPDLVASEDLSEANTLFQVVNYAVDLIAFPVAGVVVALFIARLGIEQGTFFVFGVDAASYLLSATLLFALPIRRANADWVIAPLNQLAGQVAEGLRFLRHHSQLRTNTILLTVGPLMLGSLHTLWIGFAWRVSNTGTFGYAVIETANALGTLAGLWLLPRVLKRLNAGRTILFGFGVMGLGATLAGFSQSLPVVAGLAAVCGLGNMMFLVPSITLVQRQAPPGLRGRVFAVRLMLTFSAFSVSNALAGGLADSVGVSQLLLVLGGGMLLLATTGCLFASAREAG
ncbi:MAG: MFS transporter [Chloroflexi bacterium]|nr:MFS transporter [Chloroflexota bacterium]